MKKQRGLQKPRSTAKTVAKAGNLLNDLRKMIEQARQSVATAINTRLTILYWRMGYRIRSEILGKKRAEFGEEIVATLSHQLTLEYGQGFTLTGLRRMVKFAELFPDEQIVATLSHQLSWSHFVEIIPLKE